MAKGQQGWRVLLGIGVIAFYPVQSLWERLLGIDAGFYTMLLREHPLASAIVVLLTGVLSVRLLGRRKRIRALAHRLAMSVYRNRYLD